MNSSAANNNTGKIKPWYSYSGKKFPGPFPAFFETEKWEWIAQSEPHFEIFRSEIEALLTKKNHLLQPYFNSSLTDQEDSWHVLNFYFWGEKNETNCSSCPELQKFLGKIPGMVTATVSRLAPHSEIHPHIGDTNAVARCHLGLIVPAPLPECGIEVKGEKRSWEEGKWLAFCDAYLHSAWNHTAAYRYILIIDVMLPEFYGMKRAVIQNVRSLLRLQKLLAHRKWMQKLPGPVLGFIRLFFRLIS